MKISGSKIVTHCPFCGKRYEAGYACADKKCADKRKLNIALHAQDFELEQRNLKILKINNYLEKLFSESHLESVKYATFDRLEIDNDNREAIADSRIFAESVGSSSCKDRVFLITGKTGSGKTSLIAAIMHRLASREIRPTYFTGRLAADYFHTEKKTEEDRILKTFAQRRLSKLKAGRVIILDDLSYLHICSPIMILEFQIFLNSRIEKINNDNLTGLIMAYEGRRKDFFRSKIFGMGQASAESRLKNMAKKSYYLGATDRRGSVDFSKRSS